MVQTALSIYSGNSTTTASASASRNLVNRQTHHQHTRHKTLTVRRGCREAS